MGIAMTNLTVSEALRLIELAREVDGRGRMPQAARRRA